MGINLSTAGMKLLYAVEATAGVRPTTGYIELKGIKTTPSLNPAPDTLETTTLNETEYKTYIDGLKDLGGALEINFNLTEELITLWDNLMDAYQAGKLANKATWFCIVHPDLTKAFFFTGNPSEMGLPETEVNTVLEITNYITPTNAPAKFEKPTVVSG